MNKRLYGYQMITNILADLDNMSNYAVDFIETNPKGGYENSMFNFINNYVANDEEQLFNYFFFNVGTCEKVCREADLLVDLIHFEYYDFKKGCIEIAKRAQVLLIVEDLKKHKRLIMIVLLLKHILDSKEDFEVEMIDEIYENWDFTDIDNIDELLNDWKMCF